MEHITSVNNKTIKRLVLLQQKAKERRQAQSFVIEGIRLFADAPERYLKSAFVSEKLWEELQQNTARGDADAAVLVQKISSLPSAAVVTDEVMAKAADTKTPQGILAEARQPIWTVEEILDKKAPLLLILEDVQDPGNLGTMFRTAEAAGVDGIIMSRQTADLFNPKAVRATMSAIFRQPFVYTDDLHGTMKTLQQHGVALYAAYLQGSEAYDLPDYRTGAAFLIGNEGNGLTKETAELSDRRVRIPMEGAIESLNAAMSAGILMYEAYRQRRRG